MEGIEYRYDGPLMNTCNLSRENKAEIEIKCSGRYRIPV
jgi:hypothetical protein